MAAGPLGRAAPDRRLVFAAALVLALVGHAAWFIAVDPSPAPYLSEARVADLEAAAEAFPKLEAPMAWVVLEAREGASVLEPEALTALADLRKRIGSDEVLAPALAETGAVVTVLSVLEPRLEGGPGRWDQAAVDAAVANATTDPTARQVLRTYLSKEARLGGDEPRADATALVVQFRTGADPAALDAAGQRLVALAAGTAGPFTLTVLGPTGATDAARSPLALLPILLVPLVVGVVGLVGDGSLRRGGAWALAVASGAGSGLLVGVAAGHPSPAALTIAHTGAALGLVSMLGAGPSTTTARTAGWVTTAAMALPALALAGWAPVGIGDLALVMAVALVGAAVTLAWLPGPEPPSRRSEGVAGRRRRTREDGERGKGPANEPAGRGRHTHAAAALVLVLVAASWAASGLPEAATTPWQGNVPAPTQGARAMAALDVHFPDGLPGRSLALVVWGPLTDPGTLVALENVATRFEAALADGGAGNGAGDGVDTPGGERAATVLTLARDWADDAGRERRYDPAFAGLWANATMGGPVPLRDVAELWRALEALDPDGFHDVATSELDAAAVLVDPAGARRLARDVVTLEAAQATLQAGGHRTVLIGPGLDAPVARKALEEAVAPVTAATLLGALVAVLVVGVVGAGSAGPGRRATSGPEAAGRDPRLVALVGTAALLAVPTALSALALTSRPITPASLVAPVVAAGLTLVTGLSYVSAQGRARATGAPGTAAADEADATTGRAAVTALVLAAVPAAAAFGTLAPQGFAAGTALVAAVLVAALLRFGVVGPLAAALSASPVATTGHEQALPELAHTSCPVCSRMTATGASRCTSCGRWNVHEACPAHPEAFVGTCAVCGETLDEPRFA